MAISLGQAILYLKGDKSDLDQTLASSERETRSWAGRIGGFVRDAFAFTAGNLIANGIQRITASLAGMGNAGVEAYTTNERMTASFQALIAKQFVAEGKYKDIASAQSEAAIEAARLLGWSQKLAVLSPFGQEDISKAFNLAMGFQFTAKEGQYLTQVLVDTAAATGNQGYAVEQATRALGQMNVKGKASLEEINQLTEAGVPAIGYLADAFGKTEAEMIDLISKGLVPGKDAVLAIVSGLDEDFGGAAARQSATIGGLINSLKDLGMVGLRELLGGSLRAVQPYLVQLTDALGNPAVVAQITALGDVLGQHLGQTLAWIAGVAIPWIISAWQDIGPAISVALDMLWAAWDILAEIGSYAWEWGANITTQFAQGIYDGASFVMDALSWVGDQITYWLEPHSPPKLLPNLDQWGAAAMRVYMDGWTAGYYNIFDSIAGEIEDGLRSMASVNALPEGGLIQQIVGTRSAVAEAIAQLRATGDVTQEVIDKVRAAAGPAGGAVADLAESLIKQADATEDLDKAQSEFNETTEEHEAILGRLEDELTQFKDYYDDVLNGLNADLKRVNDQFDQRESPIDDQLAAIDAQQQAIEDAERLAELQKIIDDKGKSQGERDKARLEKQEILLEQQKRALEAERAAATEGVEAQIAATEAERDAKVAAKEQEIEVAEQERDAAVAAAQAKLDAAKAAKEAADEEVASRKAVVDEQRKMNDLLREQISLEEKAAKAAEQAAKKASGAKKKGGPKGGAAKPSLKLPNRPEMAPRDDKPAAEEEDTGPIDRLLALEPQLAQSGGRIKAALAPAFGWVQQNVGMIVGGLLGLGAAFLLPVGGAISLAGAFGGVVPLLVGLLSPIPLLTTLFGGFGGILRQAGIAAMYIRSPLGALSWIFDLIRLTLGMVSSNLLALLNPLTLVSGAWGMLGAGVGAILPFFGMIGSAFLSFISPIGLMSAGLSALGGVFSLLLNPIVVLTVLMAALGAAWTQNIANIQGATFGALAAVQGVILAFVSMVMTAWQTHGDAILASTQATWNTIVGVVGSVVAAVMTVVTSVLSVVQDFIQQHGAQIMANLSSAWQSIMGVIQTALLLIQAIVVPMLVGIGNFIMEHKELIVGVLMAAWNLIYATIKTALDLIQGILSVALAVARGDWSTAWNAMKELLGNTWDNIKTIMGTALDWVENSISLVWQAIKTAATSLGGDVIGGILQGVEDAASKLYAALKRIAGNALQAAKEALGIASPSKAFAQLGRWIPPGLVQGAEKTIGAAKQAIGQMMTGLVSDMSLPQLAVNGPTIARGSLQLQPIPASADTRPAGDINVTVKVDKVENKDDIEVLAYRVAQVIKRKQR